MHPTLPLLVRTEFQALRRRTVETLQLNLGYRCNQSCVHCHVNAGPTRTEEISRETIDDVLAFLKTSPGVRTLDLTGGAPELNAHFRSLVAATRELEVQVIDRCNLTILEEPGQGGLAEFLADHGVEVVASMPCYLEDNVDRQRGRGTFDWQGYLYDCDFNQQLGLPLAGGRSRRVHLREVEAKQLERQPIRVGDHCFGCTAGHGSSCGGALGAATT